MARLPVSGSDNGTWGTILNDFLSVEHNSDGTLRASGTLAGKAPTTRLISAGTGLSGGGDLSADRSFAVNYGTTAGTAAQGNDSRITGAVQSSLFTTKGDIISASAANTPARLGVGTNGQYLVADSDVTLGVKWADDYYILATDYNAVFDGSTNDAAALQAAINAAISSKRPLVLPAGTAVVGTSLSINGPITIIGCGREATTLKAANGLNGYVISFTGGTAGVGIIGATLCDFKIDGNSANQTAGGGILADGAVQCTFERLHLTSCYDWGLKLGPITGGAFGHHNRVINCLFDQGGGSAGYGGGAWTTSSDENWFLATDFEYLGGASNPVGSTPVMLYDLAGLQHIISCNFVSGSHNCIGIRVQNAQKTKITDSTFDGTSGDCIFIAGNKCIVSNNLITAPGDAGNTTASGIHLEFNTHFNIITSNSLETSNTVAGRVRSLIREEGTGGAGDNIIEANSVTWGAFGPTVALIESGGTNTIVRNNIGWKTENGGTATVASGTTSITLNHGLDFTPALSNIAVTATNNLGNATRFWISNANVFQFTINVDVDPGAGTATFAWLVRS